MDIPHSPEDVSPDWLTMALRQGHAIGADTVSRLESSCMEPGKGFYGQIFRLKLSYESPRAEGPQSMIVKLSSGNPAMRQRPNTKASYAQELRFYQTLANKSVLPTPTCYYSDIDLESGWHVLLLEDLAPARSGSRIDGCSVAQAQTAIHYIGRFHAHWWQNPELETLDWLAPPLGTSSDADRARLHEQWWPAFLQEVGQPLPDEVMEIGELLGRYRGRLTRLARNEPTTVRHGDYHLENLMFGGAAERSFCVVDWHFVSRGRGVADVARFLTELAPANRRAIEMDLLKDYVRILVDHGVRNYSVQDAMYDYGCYLLGRFGSLISSIAAMPFTEEQIRFHVDVLLPRNIAALVDLGCRSLFDSGSPLYDIEETT